MTKTKIKSGIAFLLSTVVVMCSHIVGFAGAAEAGKSQEIVGTVQTLTVDSKTLVGCQTVSVSIKENDGDANYSGVSLRGALAKLAPVESMDDMRKLSSSVIVVTGADGFRAVVSAAAVAADKSGKQYVLSTSRTIDSKEQEPGGTIRLIVPGDAKRVRWIRDVASIKLVHLDL